jgi:hypothetical protein
MHCAVKPTKPPMKTVDNPMVLYTDKKNASRLPTRRCEDDEDHQQQRREASGGSYSKLRKFYTVRKVVTVAYVRVLPQA